MKWVFLLSMKEKLEKLGIGYLKNLKSKRFMETRTGFCTAPLRFIETISPLIFTRGATRIFLRVGVRFL